MKKDISKMYWHRAETNDFVSEHAAHVMKTIWHWKGKK